MDKFTNRNLEPLDLLLAKMRVIHRFAGGGAITHCTVLSGKWRNIYANDHSLEGINGFSISALDYRDVVIKPNSVVYEKIYCNKPAKRRIEAEDMKLKLKI